MPQGQTLPDAFRENFNLGGRTGGSVGAAELRRDGGDKIFVVADFRNLVKDVPIAMFFDDLFFAIRSFSVDFFVTILHLLIFHDAQPLHTF